VFVCLYVATNKSKGKKELVHALATSILKKSERCERRSQISTFWHLCLSAASVSHF